MVIELNHVRLAFSFPSYRVGFFGNCKDGQDKNGYSLSVVNFAPANESIKLIIEGHAVAKGKISNVFPVMKTHLDFRSKTSAVALRKLEEAFFDFNPQESRNLLVLEVKGTYLLNLNNNGVPIYTPEFDGVIDFYSGLLARRGAAPQADYRSSASNLKSLRKKFNQADPDKLAKIHAELSGALVEHANFLRGK